MEEQEGRIPAYSLSIEQKTKGEMTWRVSVHLDDKEQALIDLADLVGKVIAKVNSLKAGE